MHGRTLFLTVMALIWAGAPAAVNAETLPLGEAIISRSEKLSDAELDGQRGGSETLNISDLNINLTHVNGNVSENVVNGVFTGTNNIDSSFNAAQGLFTIINNFGPNSLIQHIMIVDIDVVQ